jgi:hypothetical protein
MLYTRGRLNLAAVAGRVGCPSVERKPYDSHLYAEWPELCCTPRVTVPMRTTAELRIRPAPTTPTVTERRW